MQIITKQYTDDYRETQSSRTATIPSTGPATIPSTGPATIPSTGPATIPSTGPATSTSTNEQIETLNKIREEQGLEPIKEYPVKIQETVEVKQENPYSGWGTHYRDFSKQGFANVEGAGSISTDPTIIDKSVRETTVSEHITTFFYEKAKEIKGTGNDILLGHGSFVHADTGIVSSDQLIDKGPEVRFSDVVRGAGDFLGGGVVASVESLWHPGAPSVWKAPFSQEDQQFFKEHQTALYGQVAGELLQAAAFTKVSKALTEAPEGYVRAQKVIEVPAYTKTESQLIVKSESIPVREGNKIKQMHPTTLIEYEKRTGVLLNKDKTFVPDDIILNAQKEGNFIDLTTRQGNKIVTTTYSEGKNAVKLATREDVFTRKSFISRERSISEALTELEPGHYTKTHVVKQPHDIFPSTSLVDKIKTTYEKTWFKPPSKPYQKESIAPGKNYFRDLYASSQTQTKAEAKVKPQQPKLQLELDPKNTVKEDVKINQTQTKAKEQTILYIPIGEDVSISTKLYGITKTEATIFSLRGSKLSTINITKQQDRFDTTTDDFTDTRTVTDEIIKTDDFTDTRTVTDEIIIDDDRQDVKPIQKLTITTTVPTPNPVPPDPFIPYPRRIRSRSGELFLPGMLQMSRRGKGWGYGYFVQKDPLYMKDLIKIGNWRG